MAMAAKKQNLFISFNMHSLDALSSFTVELKNVMVID